MSEDNLTVLLVEADEATRDLYHRALSQYFDVFIAATEMEAYELLQSREFEAVVLEPVLEQGDGWRLLANIAKARPAAPPLTLVCSSVDDRKRGYHLGAHLYLVKPVLPATLARTLRQALHSRSILRGHS
ncbi:MAG: response regulator [Chloroflexi bacterium]|nr:MAG: response regulator [Chloroflexota bacterium]